MVATATPPSAPPAVNVKINGLRSPSPAGTTILEAARQVLVKIPTLCQDDDLLPTAACGLWHRPDRRQPRMPRACLHPVVEGMDITTHMARSPTFRRTVLELLLLTHPSSCPHLRTEGTCELQALAATSACTHQRNIKRIVTPSRPNTSQRLDHHRLHEVASNAAAACMVCRRCKNVWALSLPPTGASTPAWRPPATSPSLSHLRKMRQCSNHCPTGAIVVEDETPRLGPRARRDQSIAGEIAPACAWPSARPSVCRPGPNLTGKLTPVPRLGFKRCSTRIYFSGRPHDHGGGKRVHRHASVHSVASSP